MATHSLHIGINDYRGTGHHLAGCVRDVRDDERLFNAGRRRRGAVRDSIDECRFFGTADTQILLTDRRATRETILAALGVLMKRLEAGDWGIFTFSGHGSYVRDESKDESDGYDEALVCYGLDVILDDELGELLARRNAKSKLLVITDSCHSGTATRSLVGPRLLGPTTPADPVRRQRFLPPNRIPRDKRGGWAVAKREPKLFNTIHLAACLDEEFAEEGQFGGATGGVFSWFAKHEALASLPRGATYGDWCAAIGDELPNSDWAQEPRHNAYARCLDWKLPAMK